MFAALSAVCQFQQLSLEAPCLVAEFGYPSAEFGYPSAEFGYPSAEFGYPAAEFGLLSAAVEYPLSQAALVAFLVPPIVYSLGKVSS